MTTFKQDTEETPVLFRKSRRNEPEGLGAEVTAVFPCEAAHLTDDTMTCYAHVGQHGACGLGWYTSRTRAAKPEEYAALKQELESAPYGYRLKVYKRMQPWMRDVRRGMVKRKPVRKAGKDQALIDAAIAAGWQWDEGGPHWYRNAPGASAFAPYQYAKTIEEACELAGIKQTK